MMVDFSIIIPIYNAEKTLRRCLDSIKTQTIKSYEVLLIDDGSSDNSLKICKEYEEKDHRYKVFQQINKGPSTARNVGLDEAEGEWICFVDSDDTIEPDYLQELFCAIQKHEAEVAFVGYHKVFKNGNRELNVPDNMNENIIETFKNLSDKDMFGYTWIKSFRKDVIGNMRFDPELRLFEDEVFTCQVVQECTKVGVVRKPIYNYYTGNGNTLIGRTYDDYPLNCDKVYLAWQRLLTTQTDDQVYLNNKANSFVARCYYYAFEREVDLKKYFRYLKDTTFFQKHTKYCQYDKLVKTEKYARLKAEKLKYRARVCLSSYLKR